MEKLPFLQAIYLQCSVEFVTFWYDIEKFKRNIKRLCLKVFIRTNTLKINTSNQQKWSFD